jgi:peptide-methionine (R)-S-oxide reductase
MKSYWNHLLLSLSYLILIERKVASALLLRSHDQSLTPTFLQSKIHHHNDDVDVDKPSTPPGNAVSQLRRRTTMKMALLIAAVTTLPPKPATAAGTKSRTQGYAVQKTDEEWKSVLTPRQYEILRSGGTERPYSSILESEKRTGTFYCAGCGTALFESKQKFKSGTGWPSFAAALDGVEVEKVNPVQLLLKGAELRCRTCGGHLGDVFNDGFLFVGTPAAETGKRFCIDGSALVFRPADGSPEVVGDQVPAKVEYYYN